MVAPSGGTLHILGLLSPGGVPFVARVVATFHAAGVSDVTLLVLAENEVTRGESGQCKHALSQVGANLLGVILNKVHYQPEAYYYYYYRYRGYE